MKFLDLLRMSCGNLWRRKLRTILTVLGVVIGTASIVVMVSLGIGMNKSFIEEIEKSGELTTITVNSYGDYYVVGSSGAVSSGGTGSEEEMQLNDEMVEQFKTIPHVTLVSPVLTIDVYMKQGKYECSYLTIRGMTLEALKAKKFEFAEGGLPNPGDPLQLIVGNQVNMQFYDPKGNDSVWMDEDYAGPEIDFMNKPLFTIFDQDAYWQAQNGEGKMPKKYMLQACGILGGDLYTNDSWEVYADIDALKTQLKKVFKGKAIPGQPTTKSGKAYKELIYNEVYVQVDDMKYTEEVQNQINGMGFQAYSSIEYVNTMKKQSSMIQAVLGGIGAVSLFVAAIGIANTMMMSIYERTKEIGIIKVLGCSLGNIRSMFLMEAGFIGFLGGIVGIALSYGVSAILNTFLGNLYSYGGESSAISYIPLWLVLAALGFAILVGMVAGFFPALRAMRLSPLAAIRND